MSSQINKLNFNDTGCICKEQLLRYRDRQLSGNAQHEVEEHLVDCLLCNEALEGLLLLKDNAVLDLLHQEVSSLVHPVRSTSLRPWLAAATLAGVFILSYVTYVQYTNINEERLAVHEINSPVTEKLIPASGTGLLLPDTMIAPAVTLSADNAIYEPVQNKAEELIKDKSADATIIESAAGSESSDVLLQTQQRSSVSKMEVPVAASKDDATNYSTVRNTLNKNITYVANLKIIDYSEYNIENIQQADRPRGTPSKYPNNKNQTEAVASEQISGAVINRKSTYLEQVADPVILFNKGRYESANAGFDKLLAVNAEDQNAAFYKGLSFYHLKQFDSALKFLLPISNDSRSPFMEEAKIYAARSYISNNEVYKGKVILENLSNSNGFYSKQAQEELNKIKQQVK